MKFNEKKYHVQRISFPKVITDILAHILNVQFSYPDRLPSVLFSASKKCKRAFLRAMFDDEGTVSTNIGICIHNEEIILSIKDLLLELGIHTGTINRASYRTRKGIKIRLGLNISVKSAKSFKKLIGFSHPIKSKNLNILIETWERKIYERTRPVEDIDRIILNLLKKKPCTTLYIAQQLKLTIAGTYFHLSRLLSENKIRRTGFKNKAIWA